MEKVSLYEYSKHNFEEIQKEMTIYYVTLNDIQQLNDEDKEVAEKHLEKIENFECFDLTLLISLNNGRIDLWVSSMINIFKCVQKNKMSTIFIINKTFSKDVLDSMYAFVDEILPLEFQLGIETNLYTNIVDIENFRLVEFQNYIDSHIFGNTKLKSRLFEEIHKFRVFNRIDEQPIFSAFLCGNSGIGKTELAMQIHKYLSPDESFIKINLGNYSGQNSLSSLIGSPRGYYGSDSGELSDKIHGSNSSVILIDEFEKADHSIFNFFLELLSDGKFTDSLGREYDLNKYIIIFTSNLAIDEINSTIPPELRSRFNLFYKLVPLTDQDKSDYVSYKCEYYSKKISDEYEIEISQNQLNNIANIDVSKYNNLRYINKQIQLNLLNELKDEII
ncbi:ATP-dependent Clp protease ATP-binding subunit [Enterococcus sp. BWM-S5]|uniref:ATP-dependent Clp protease ATP-binding subunit n=1 Tax=Enterococcus larvae TaxID=2794352 RepID=A0ABS4CLV2_9ENTE|nr:AAA family ATPase [Enterococcus larvae]MBP1047153.1 ATP-dependent Clp protease ATP-binding subunit [Enterococcus larvae]